MSNKLLGNLQEGLLFVISAPAGTGKTTLSRMLAAEFPSIALSISCTTRPSRAHEVPGQDYHFISKELFEEKLSQRAFIEHAKIFDHYYGTLAEEIAQERQSGRHVVLVIDTQGMRQIQDLGIKTTSIFIHPPSWNELRLRLEKRGTETVDAIEKRLSFAKHELREAHLYDYEIVNDHLETAYQILRAIIIAEEHKKLKRR